MRTDYVSCQALEICGPEDTYNESEVTIGLECSASSSPGSYDPFDGGYPPEGPEFELTSISVDVPKVNSKTTPKELDKPLELSYTQFCAVYGEEVADALIECAITDACENGGF